jgi:aldehyde dehydrogenase (NAD+)
MIEHNGLWVGGQLVESDSPRGIEVESPSTEEVIGSVPDSTPADLERVVTAARTAFDRGD